MEPADQVHLDLLNGGGAHVQFFYKPDDPR